MTRDFHREQEAAIARVNSLTTAIAAECSTTELACLYTKRAACYESLGDYTNTVADYTKALELAEEDSHLIHIKSMLALAYLAQEQNETALFLALDAVEHDGENAEARHIFGLVCAHCGFFNSAIDSLRHAMKLRPDCWEAMLKLGECLREKGRMEESIEILSSYVAENGDDPRGLYELGWSIHFTPTVENRKERARQLYGNALKKNPSWWLRTLIQKRLNGLGEDT